MIHTENNLFVLETDNTAYAFKATSKGTLQHLYYGVKLPLEEDYLRLVPPSSNPPGNSAVLGEKELECMESLFQEAGTEGYGDVREPLLLFTCADGSRSARFVYFNYTIEPEETSAPLELPSAHGGGKTLKIVLKEQTRPIYLELYYTVFEKTDVIVKWSRICNDSSDTLMIRRLLSNQLELPYGEYNLHNFRGAWAREMNQTKVPLYGKECWGSVTGTSSNRCNPFFMVSEKGAGERNGSVWAMNLIYSGNHLGIAERSTYGSVRILQGMDGVEWKLGPKEKMDAPQAVLTYSAKGFSGISVRMHAFVRRHIVRGEWQNRERPILANSWEAMYFKVDRKKLLALGKEAKSLGIELLVLDDGWFKERKDDTRALGDWTEDTKKLPQGLKGLGEDIRKMGLDFGIWVEPEMVSEESDLFRQHPDWILGRKEQAIGRHQYVLDLSREEVCDYIRDSVSNILKDGTISYVKWDMNRIFTDTYSSAWDATHQGEITHRYILGLYRVLRELTEKFPHVLFESCSSGGNRADLGMLCYMPQVWASDNTDTLCRTTIQTGYSYGYPQSALGCHVSACPNHQTLRMSPLSSRLAVASFGLLGFELDLSTLSSREKDEIKKYIEFYKAHRHTFQFGQIYRSWHTQNEMVMTVVSGEKMQAVTLEFVAENQPNTMLHPLKIYGLDNKMAYHVTCYPMEAKVKDFGSLVNIMAPVQVKQGSFAEDMADRFVKLPKAELEFDASGTMLQEAGFYPLEVFCGNGFNDLTQVRKDFGSRIYTIDAI